MQIGISPAARLINSTNIGEAPPEHNFHFKWCRTCDLEAYKDEIRCNVQPDLVATVKCNECEKLKLPAKLRYHCSYPCYKETWERHKMCHLCSKAVGETSSNNQPVEEEEMYTWPQYNDNSLDTRPKLVRDGKQWVEVCSSMSYEPTEEDHGCRLMLITAVDCKSDIIQTVPVQYVPGQETCSILECQQKSGDYHLKAHSSGGERFSVLSYNVLADVYAHQSQYSHLPEWSCSCEYRQQNVLNEIIEYNADILCLQEVLSTRHKNFITPELAKLGYSVTHKKKSGEQALLIKISAIEAENKDNTKKIQAEIQKKAEQIDGLLTLGETHEQHVDSMNKQVSQLHSTLEEKEQLIVQDKEREKNLEEQITENRASLTATETRLVEDKKQYDLILESKQLELSRPLKDISQRNDQVSNLQQEHDEKEHSLKAKHSEELKQIQLQAENEMREKVTSLKNEHEAQLRALRLQHEDEIKKLEEDLNLQKSKEEKQRALLQLQWNVMSNKPEEQEVSSKKEYSISSRRNPVVRRRGQHSLRKPEHVEKDSPPVGATQTPVSTLLKKASQNMNSPSVMNISKHHNKLVRDEYEVETGNGRTIKRKTRSTVMFEDPRKHKRTTTPKVKSPRAVVKGSKGEGQPRASNIGDLFSEGSLNPYADDPYAF